MERAKQIIKDPKLAPVFDHIFRNGLGNLVILDSAPTTKEELKPNVLAYHNNILYLRLANGELKKVTLTDIP
jgi:hypothetical protein